MFFFTFSAILSCKIIFLTSLIWLIVFRLVISRDTGILIESNLIDDVYVLYILITMHALIYIHLLLVKLLGITLVSVRALEIIFDICDVATNWLYSARTKFQCSLVFCRSLVSKTFMTVYDGYRRNKNSDQWHFRACPGLGAFGRTVRRSNDNSGE